MRFDLDRIGLISGKKPGEQLDLIRRLLPAGIVDLGKTGDRKALPPILFDGHHKDGSAGTDLYRFE